jgi:transposase
MPTCFLPYEPNQNFLLPRSLSEWLPENHLAYFVSEIIDRLDLQKFYARYEGEGRRNQPYDPAMLVKVFGVRVRHRSVLFAQDSKKAVRGCSV